MSFLSSLTDEPTLWCENDGNKVPVMAIPGSCPWPILDGAMKSYEWRDNDVLLATYLKTGTHYVWEIMMMLLQGKSESIPKSKLMCMIDVAPCQAIDAEFPSPRVLNTHYRLNCLPKAFQGKKTVTVLRNPKDTLVSLYYHIRGTVSILYSRKALPVKMDISKFTFSKFLHLYMSDSEVAYGNYLDYVAYMWSIKDDPNLLVLFYEDVKRKPLENIKKLNEFMGTNRDEGLQKEIEQATSFQKMKSEKQITEQKLWEKMFPDNGETTVTDEMKQFSVFRRGEIGDWKNHFSKAENDLFDEQLKEWQKGKDIPFTYE